MRINIVRTHFRVRFKENTEMFVCVCLFIYQITQLCVCIIMSALQIVNRTRPGNYLETFFNTTNSKSKRSEYYAQHVFEQQFNYLGHNEHLGNATIGIVTILLLVCNVTLLIMKVTVSYCNFASFSCVELPSSSAFLTLP